MNALKQSMSLLNKSANDEFINPVDKQIAEIFMINGLSEMPNGSSKSSCGLHRSGSDRKHTWLQDLNEEETSRGFFDDLAESAEEEKSVYRDSIGGE